MTGIQKVAYPLYLFPCAGVVPCYVVTLHDGTPTDSSIRKTYEM